ncbi:MAG: pilus assembly protein PilM [Planctomycetota bacterium]
MFGGNNKKSRRPIGVSVTLAGVRLAQVSPTADGYALSATAFEPLPESLSIDDANYGRELGYALSAALKQANFTGKQCVSAMPPESMHCKNIRLPKMPEAELAEAVTWEAKERIVLGEPASIQFYSAGEVRQGDAIRNEVVLLATKCSNIDAHVQGLTQAGLEPTAIDATGAALARISAGLGNTSFTVFAGTKSLEVVIARGGRVLLNKLLPVGEAGLDNADTAELAREIGLCLRYHTVTFRGEKPASILFAGEPVPDALVNAVTQALGIPATSLDEASGFSHHANETLSPWAVAAGLSMRGLAAPAMRGAA